MPPPTFVQGMSPSLLCNSSLPWGHIGPPLDYGGHAGQEACIWGHMKARGTYSPGPRGPRCVGGRGHRGTDIPISGTGSDAAGDANDVPPPLLLLNQLPKCQVLGKGHTFRIWAQNGNCQRSNKNQAGKEEQSTKLQNRSLE